MKINLLLGIINTLVDILLGVPFSPAVMYLYLAPYIIFLILRVPSSYLHLAIIIISMFIGLSVLFNFIDTLSGVSGYEKVSEYHQKLRPDIFTGLSRTGEFVRPGGFTGNYHDAANILGMVSCFFFIQYIVERKLYSLIFFLGTILAMAVTQSAANILVAFATLFLFSSYIIFNSSGAKKFLYIFLGAATITLFIIQFYEVFAIFLDRINSSRAWEGMLNQLDASSILNAVPYILAGHAGGMESLSIDTEIGLYDTLLQIGIVHCVVFFSLLLFPVYKFFSSKNKNFSALPSLSAVFFGFFSLLHYGSVMRVTSVFLFFLFYSLCLSHCFQVNQKN